MDENINMGEQPIQPPPPETQPAPPPPPPVQQPISEPPKKKSFIKPLLFIFIFLLLGAGIYYLIFEMNILEAITDKNLDNNSTDEQNTEETQEQKEDGEEVEETETLTPYEGKYISTKLAEGWSVEEYVDGEGTEMLPGGTQYTGLTGLKIFKGEEEIFYMQAVSGLGFAGCPNYAKFTDENPEYYAQILEDNEVSGQELTVQDYTTTQYEEFTWLGMEFRRIEKEYVYDEIANNEYFEPPCVPSLVAFDNVKLYSDIDGYESSTFDYGAKDIATSQDLLVVDQILNDMELVKSE